MAKFLSGLFVFLLTFVIGWFAAGYYYLSIPIEQQLAKPRYCPPPPDNVSDRTKAKIIISLLSTQEKSKHSGRWDGVPYLDISEPVFKMLPKTINGVSIRLYGTADPSSNIRIDRVTFNGWHQTGNILTVTWSTEFYDRNLGGCSYKFALTDSRWQQISADCFATAS